MALFDWLFSGSPPPTATSTVTTQPSLPDWYQELIRGVAGKADALGAVPYTPFTGDRVAGLTPDQQSAYAMIRGLPGQYTPTLGTAGTALETAAGAPSASSVANPFLSAANQTWPGAVDQYMNPYNAAVTDRIAELGARNLNEFLLPQVNDTFINAGQFGGSRNADFTARAVRDTQESILGQQAQTLQQGYNTGANIFNADMARMMGLGSTAGGLANLDTTANLQTAAQAGNLANLIQNLGLRTGAAQEAAGIAQQGQAQNLLDVDYQNFLEQRQYPYQQLGFVSDILRGTPQPQQGTTTTSVAPATGGTSPLGQIAGAGTALAALLGVGKKRGGLIKRPPRRYARGGLACLEAA